MPSLPFELERLIFEIAAIQDTNHNHRIQLILVAKRVYEWIRPILYRIVIIRNDLRETSGALTIHNWPNPQFNNSARFFRHLSVALPGYSYRFIDIVSSSPNIEDLASWDGTISCEVLRKMNQLPLRRVSFYPGSISIQEAIGLCPAFKNLTHLEIYDISRESDWKVLRELPKLTHLSFIFSYLKDEVPLDLLKHCASLRVFIYTIEEGWYYRYIKSDDPRYLVLLSQPTIDDLIEDWARSANGLIGCWEIAEFIIDARKANLFKDTTPSVLSRKAWMEHLNDDGDRWYKEWIENGGGARTRGRRMK